ncbi:conserved domain protein [delta proteobacterium NaphS2]|nr:conserved domain protein [delta proteobacterium NaphS2]
MAKNQLTVGDIDSVNMRVHIRDAKATKTGWCRCLKILCAC